MSHTKGPWTIRGNDPVKTTFIDGSKTWLIQEAKPESELPNHICFASSWISNPDDALEAKANARLISCAPELLEALEVFANLANLFDDGVRAGCMPSTGTIMSWPRLSSDGSIVENEITVEDLRVARQVYIKARGQ